MDFLVQRVWAFTLSGVSSVVFVAPRKMADKTASCHFGGLQGLVGFPISFGVAGVNISHGVWDRGIYTAQYRLFWQAHQKSIAQASASLLLGEARLLDLLSWCVGNGCCDHDCHGALRRAMTPDIDDKGVQNAALEVARIGAKRIFDHRRACLGV